MSPFNRIDIVLEGKSFSARTLLFEKGTQGKKELIALIRRIITRINEGCDFGDGPAEEFTNSISLLLQGFSSNLINPYSSMVHYESEPLIESTLYRSAVESVRILKSIPDRPLTGSSREEMNLLKRTLLLLAAGGADTTFYSGLSNQEISDFEKDLFLSDILTCIQNGSNSASIPRTLASKKNPSGRSVSILESIILQAYHAGIRNVAVIGNSRTAGLLSNYLHKVLGSIKDLNLMVIVQPLLPMIQRNPEGDFWTIAVENGAYPGGHGQGFKYCFSNPMVQKNIKKNKLVYFLFSNGDNVVLFNWGAAHLTHALQEMDKTRALSGYEHLRTGFLLVWEHFRKGGFAYHLIHEDTHQTQVQIVEAELAVECSSRIQKTGKIRAAYNTNVALGSIRDVEPYLRMLPLMLKSKSSGGIDRCVFEASLSTALTIKQKANGESVFDRNAALFFIPPKEAAYPHWSHLSVRKRDDLFAFYSSLFKIQRLQTDYGHYPLLVTERNATINYPALAGDILEPNILNTKEFFDIFKNAEMNLNYFTGTLKINLHEDKNKQRGHIRFEGKIRLLGKDEISIIVPSGASRIIRDRTIRSPTILEL